METTNKTKESAEPIPFTIASFYLIGSGNSVQCCIMLFIVCTDAVCVHCGLCINRIMNVWLGPIYSGFSNSVGLLVIAVNIVYLLSFVPPFFHSK